MIPTAYAHLPPLLDINQVCEELSVSRRTVYNWMSAGRVEWVMTPGGGRRIVTESLWRAGEPAGNGGVRKVNGGRRGR